MKKRRKALINWSPSLYDRLAKNYDKYARWFFPIGDRGHNKVLSGLKLGSILDLACGTGRLLNKAHQKGMTCFGVDTSRGMLDVAKKIVPRVDLVQASFYALPFKVGQFDYVVETNAVSGTDIEASDVLSEMLRVCCPGGEVRLGDYSKVERKGFWFRVMEFIGILIGDYPYDYLALFRELGYQAEVEDLGWGGMYKYIRVLV